MVCFLEREGSVLLNEPLRPMLLQPLPPSQINKNFKSSLKWDGFRILIHYDHGKVRAFTRHGTEVTSRFPELTTIKLPVKTAILDGECIAFDLTEANNQPSKLWWDDAMTRFNTKKESAVKQIAKSLRAHFPVWDILYLNGEPMLNKSFTERREALMTVIVNSEALSITPLYEDGEALFLRAKELGQEGIVQYHPDAPVSLNTRSWSILKVKAYQSQKCQISSIRLKGAFGWGLSVEGRYVGILEFPPRTEVLKAFNQVYKQLIRHEKNGWLYIEPYISCNIKFQCFTKCGKLRSPKFEEFCTSISV